MWCIYQWASNLHLAGHSTSIGRKLCVGVGGGGDTRLLSLGVMKHQYFKIIQVKYIIYVFTAYRSVVHLPEPSVHDVVFPEASVVVFSLSLWFVGLSQESPCQLPAMSSPESKSLDHLWRQKESRYVPTFDWILLPYKIISHASN